MPRVRTTSARRVRLGVALTMPAGPVGPVGPVGRVGGALALVAMMVLLLVAPWHQAAVRHVVCVEHGQAMHQDAAASALPTAAHDAHSGDHAHAVPVSAAAEHGADHDHCGAPQLSLSTARVSQPTAVDDQGSPVLRFEDPSAAPWVRALWLLAPKNSPPSAG